MSYKTGDLIADKYLVTREFDSANGGQCQWGFAVNINDGNEYFVKKFLSPVYPGEKAPGGEKSKQKKRPQITEVQQQIKYLYNNGTLPKNDKNKDVKNQLIMNFTRKL
jgi:hypothetical protein